MNDNKSKTCTQCGVNKPLSEYHKLKSGLYGKSSQCKKCTSKNAIDLRQLRNFRLMQNNKNCSLYLGVVIGERLCRHLFSDVQVMPNGNVGYDIVCNKGKFIDVKTACLTKNKYPNWSFNIKNNVTADWFILVAFDNRTDLNPLHMWLIPGDEINDKTGVQISPSTIHRWDKWKKDIDDVQICCNTMKKIKKGSD